MPAIPELEEALDGCITAAIVAVNVAFPAVVTEYDRATQRASVQPVVRFKLCTGEDEFGREILVDRRMPVLPWLPVSWMSSSGGSVVGDLDPGDSGLVVICDRDNSRWISRGGDDQVAFDLRRHDITDGVFFPGIRAIPNALPMAAYAANALVLASQDLRLGNSAAADKVATEDRVIAAIRALEAKVDALAGVFNAHVHPTGSPSTGPSPTPFTAGAANLPAVGSPHVKAT